MEKLDDKMRLIGSAVLEQAEQESRRVIDEVNAIRDRELAAYREQLIGRMFEQVQQKSRAIRQGAVRDRALAEQASRRELLAYREELAALVYSSARARLAQYTAGDDYRKRMLEQLRGLQGRWDHAFTAVQLRPADIALEEPIRGLLPGCSVQADKTIRLGGFRLRNAAAGILVDETLDAALEDTRPWFLQNCGLSLRDIG